MPKTKWVVLKSPQLTISIKLITQNFEKLIILKISVVLGRKLIKKLLNNIET